MRDVVGVVTFPGSNGDYDALHALQDQVRVPARLVDYRETELGGLAGLVLPGGFSYGDYLRCGAIARFAPVMEPLRRYAAAGGPVLGICNGFQILTEAHLLPGALLRNRTLRFHCYRAYVRIDQTATAWTGGCYGGQVLRLPVAHGDGAYYADPDTLAALEGEGRVVARYCDAQRNISHKHNPNASIQAIAGITNTNRNIVGLMPHPERAGDPILGAADGLFLLRSALSMVGLPV